MIKMKNRQLVLFGSDQFKRFYGDTERRFPVTDAFKLEEILSLIDEKIKIHTKLIREIFKKHDGYNEEGNVDMSRVENKEELEKEINELNDIDIEIKAEPLKIKENWPDISMVEMTILKHIIKP